MNNPFSVDDTKTALGAGFCGFDPQKAQKIKVDSTLNRFRTAIRRIRAEIQGKSDVDDTKTALGAGFGGFDPWKTPQKAQKIKVDSTLSPFKRGFRGFELKFKANLRSTTPKQPWKPDSVDSTLRKPLESPEIQGRLHA